MSEEQEKMLAMLERWDQNVPPTPYDESVFTARLRVAYRQGYGEALRQVRGAVKRGAHLVDPADQVPMATAAER